MSVRTLATSIGWATIGLLVGSGFLCAQSDPAVADTAVSITFQNSGGAVVGAGVSISFGSATISAVPSSLSFSYQQGTSGSPSPQNLTISASNSVALNFTAAAATTPSGGTWLSVSPTTGTTTAALSVSITPVGLAVGTYDGQITLMAAGASNSPLNVPVTLMVTPAPPPSLAVSPRSLQFASYNGIAGPPSPQTLMLSTTGAPVSFTTTTFIKGGSWLTVAPNAGQTPAMLTVTVNPAGLPIGTYIGIITITSTEASPATIQVPVSFTIALNSGSIIVRTNQNSSFTITPPSGSSFSGSGPLALFSTLMPGSYTITYGTLAGYVQPAPMTVTLAAGQAITLRAVYYKVFLVSFTGFNSAPKGPVNCWVLLLLPGTGVIYNDSGNTPYPGRGMTNLLINIRNNPALTNTISQAFTFYTYGYGVGADGDACTAPGDERDHTEAGQWFTTQTPGPNDRIVIVGHSYGGNRARLFVDQLAASGLATDLLVTVDPIDWMQCNIWNCVTTLSCALQCNENMQSMYPPATAATVVNYYQPNGIQLPSFIGGGLFSCVEGYQYVLTKSLDLTLTNHMEIENLTGVQNAIQNSIEQMLAHGKGAANILTGLTINGVASNTVTISWTSTLPSDTVVAYGTTTEYAFIVSNNGETTSHSITLTGLVPNTAYHYQVSSLATSGQMGLSVDSLFKTAQ